MVLYRLVFAATTILSSSMLASAGGGIPPNWWLNTEGINVKSNDHFKELVTGKLVNGVKQQGTLHDKHVFIDFFMEHCYWCWAFQADWNKLVHDMREMYGEDHVEFLKVNGDEIYEVSRKYSVMSFPTFIYIHPNSRGMKANQFTEERTYESMKDWMMHFMKDVPQKTPATTGGSTSSSSSTEKASTELHHLEDEHQPYGLHHDDDVYGSHVDMHSDEDIVPLIHELGGTVSHVA